MIYVYNILGKYCIYTKYGHASLYLCFMIRLLYIRDVAGPGIYIICIVLLKTFIRLKTEGILNMNNKWDRVL